MIRRRRHKMSGSRIDLSCCLAVRDDAMRDWKNKLAYRISGQNRRKKFDTFMQVFAPEATTRILDVGAAEEEYSATDNLLEKLYPHQRNITALGVDEYRKFRARYPAVQAQVYDGKIFPFPDQSFDLCWSNAVIEHVGDRERQILFLKEICRVAKNAYLTTPNRYFPVEVHTRTPLLHYLPKPLFERYLRLMGKGWAAGDYMFLLSHNDICGILRDAGIQHYRIKRNHLFGFTLDFVIMFGEKFEISRRQPQADFAYSQ